MTGAGDNRIGEFRLDPLTRRWVNIVGHRQDRPNLPTHGCPFCVGGLEAPDPYEVRWFANRWPALEPGAPLDLVAAVHDGRTRVPAVGASEVILYSPDHDASLSTLPPAQLAKVIELWAARTEALLARPEIEYVLVFENRGPDVGATIHHPHGQIYAYPFVPPEPEREGDINRAHGCASCDEVRDEAHAKDGVTRVVVGSETWLGYVPYASGYSYGLRLTPRRHVGRLADLDDSERAGLAAVLSATLGAYDRLWADAPGHSAMFPYLMWFHQAPKHSHGEHHLHAHVAPPQRAPGLARFIASGELGSGTLSNPVVPERAAAELRACLP
jgi:UDPglucose--hexose-1-phosphate uridylyltransferase